MGAAASSKFLPSMFAKSNNPDETDQQNADVERMLAEAQAEEENRFKILLLGTGESGKSTVVKQIKLIFKGGISKKEKDECMIAIRRNAIECMQTILEAMETLQIPLGNPELEDYASKIRAAGPDSMLDNQMATQIAALWQDTGVSACYDRRAEYWLLDAAPYYFQEILRLAEEDFSPNEEDMLMTRVRTTGIVVTDFQEPPYVYNVVDVGGQRSERRKWINCFDDVKAIIFLEGLSGYNQVLFEDNTQNRMVESLNLFGEIVSNPIFKETPIFIFLNKKDLFEVMIRTVPLSHTFPEYQGPEGEVGPALEFIEAKYKEVMEKHCPGKEVKIFVIAARVRMDMKMAFGECKDMIRAYHLKKKKTRKRS